MAEKETREKRPNRTEAEKAQEQFEIISRKVEAKNKQLDRIEAKMTRVSGELDDLQALQSWWASNPLVDASKG